MLSGQEELLTADSWLFTVWRFSKFAGESLSDTACMILTQNKNHIKIVIFREMSGDMASYLDKKITSSFI